MLFRSLFFIKSLFNIKNSLPCRYLLLKDCSVNMSHMPSKLYTELSLPHLGFLLVFSVLLSPMTLGQALDRLVAVSSIHYCTSTSALSTSSSSRGLTLAMGYLILRGASRLDAFSVYPFQAWLPCHGIGMPTGTPAARPSRSSRTKDSSSQISFARAG